MKIKLTSLEKHWVLYDVGNSAFTLLVSTIIPIYFDYLAEQQKLTSVSYLAYWGYAVSIATLLVALLGPALGTISDSKGLKKPIFIGAIILGAISCAALGLMTGWFMFLVVFVLAKVAYSASLIFYDSMLPDITTKERMDTVSSQGFAWGYIGSCIPFIGCLGLVMGRDFLGLTMQQSMAIAFILVALWWVLNSLPFLKSYRQVHNASKRKHALSESFSSLFHTIKNIRKDPDIFWFLLAFFFYIDGVYTIIDMATAYGKALGLDSTGLLMALLLTQFVAFPCCIIFGRLSASFKSDKLIRLCIIAYLGITIFAVFMNKQLHFWILAVLVGMFQGGIQALSRSYFAKIIPAEKAGEYFGIMDICGKGASFLGTALVSVISQLTGSINKGVGAIAILFIIGLLLFQKAVTLQSFTRDENNILEKERSLKEQKVC